MKKVYLLIMGMILFSRIFGQNFVSGYDSLPFSKPDARQMYYLIPDPVLTEITLRENYPDRRSLSHKQLITDVLFGTIALFTNAGLTLANDLDVIWELSAGLECNEDHLNWRVALFCTGYQENEREQVNNDDGSHWTEVTRTSHYEWENESVGIICEGIDTIGRFSIIMDPRDNPNLKPWSDEIYTQRPKSVHTTSKNEGYRYKLKIPCIDYGIIGRFRENDFILITHGGIRRSYFYIDKELVCIFSPDVDDYRVKMQDRIMPLMLLDNSVPFSERPDWYRLAIVTRFLNYQLERKTSVQ